MIVDQGPEVAVRSVSEAPRIAGVFRSDDWVSDSEAACGTVRDGPCQHPPAVSLPSVLVDSPRGFRMVKHRIGSTPWHQSMEPWRNFSRCAIAKSLHIQREPFQHRRAGGLHCVLTTEANPLPPLEQSLNVARLRGEPRPRVFLTPEIAIWRT